ncbi:MAG TPA: CheR family methyltransferase [Gemmatimonadales bacterium]|nr:CheR family methyltransferase [Gemmatimonadales bacterium]
MTSTPERGDAIDPMTDADADAGANAPSSEAARPASETAQAAGEAAANGAGDATDTGWRGLLEYLRTTRGFDFNGYKAPGLMRRIRRRLELLRLPTFEAYQDYLEVHPGEFGVLFNTILINVTGFFRDPEAWRVLREQVLPALLSGKRRDEPVRVWSAGCASGEEAYTLAICLAEALGADQYRERVKIYATDIDEEALATARQAVYTAAQVEGVPPELLKKYFERVDDSYTYRKDLRRQVIFGRHNLLQDAPISHIDLLVCRNVLMYFNAETQAQILSRFHFALNDGGHLFLGRAETLMSHSDIFAPVDLKRRISVKVNPRRQRNRGLPTLRGEAAADPRDRVAAHDDGSARLRECALAASPLATILVDTEGAVSLVNERARALFGLSGADVGRPLQDLRISYRPVELRSVAEQATVERRPVHVRDVEWHLVSGEVRWLDLQVAPLHTAIGEWTGTSITFTDVTAYRRLQRELEHTNQELETAYEELQSTNEELETTNEELQSTIEELETTNEELQSTNEELETMNQELQSTNEELQTINDEVRQRGDDLNASNAFLESVLASLRSGVIVVDRELRIVGWNRPSEELWGLRADEVREKHLLNLDVGLPMDQLRGPLRACLAGEPAAPVRMDAVNRRGRGVQCVVSCSPLLDSREEVHGAIVLVEA